MTKAKFCTICSYAFSDNNTCKCGAKKTDAVVIDISGKPDAGQVYIDAERVEWFRFLADYTIDDKKMSFDIWATSFEDAERRLEVIKTTATISGQLYHEEDV